MSSRLGLRLFHNTRSFFQSASRRNNPAYNAIAKRLSSTEAAPAVQQSFLQRSWHSPIGIRTVHFWAPVMKWVLVLAGIGDMARPADRLSLTQNAALTATGFIWTRWCFVIRPKNVFGADKWAGASPKPFLLRIYLVEVTSDTIIIYRLATVNFFVGCVGAVQVSRIFAHKASVSRKQQQADSATTTTTEAAVVGDA
ncbi:hypothetical protein KEM54_001055 [Ascosphaera aggregata]|nr:hypothetical protein KEM54_001055 [Ascosphaera aggregata]